MGLHLPIQTAYVKLFEYMSLREKHILSVIWMEALTWLLGTTR